MLQRLTKTAMVFALACSIGLHWQLIQSMAWLGMAVKYSRNSSLSEALAKTFDGKHPCSLCKQIAEGKQSEKASDLRPDRPKLEFSYTATSFLFSRPSHFWKASTVEATGAPLNNAPPVPPPRPSIA